MTDVTVLYWRMVAAYRRLPAEVAWKRGDLIWDRWHRWADERFPLSGPPVNLAALTPPLIDAADRKTS